MKKKMSRLFSGVLAAVMAVGMLPAYAELDVGADVDVVDNKGTSQAAVIDSAPAQFNVIVPTKLPFAILANNETLKATNAAIKNQGNGPVKLAGITAEGKGWAFADYDSVDFSKMPMNSKVFTMQLNGDKVPASAVDTKVNVPITQSAWASGTEGSIYGKTNLPISYDGKFAPQADASAEAVVAHVVFAIGWQTADGTNNGGDNQNDENDPTVTPDETSDLRLLSTKEIGDTITAGTFLMNNAVVAPAQNPMGYYGDLTPWEDGNSISFGDSDGENDITWVVVMGDNGEKVLVADRGLCNCISYDDLAAMGYVDGKNVTIDGYPFRVRLMSGGPVGYKYNDMTTDELNAKLLDCEYGRFVEACGDDNSKGHWTIAYSWTSTNYFDGELHNWQRGGDETTGHQYSSSSDGNASRSYLAVFRPVLEPVSVVNSHNYNNEFPNGEALPDRTTDWTSAQADVFYTYTIDKTTNTAEITGLSEKGKKLNVKYMPDTIDGAAITSIGDEAFNSKTNLSINRLPKNLRSIGNKAFQYSNVFLFELPEHLENIGEWAFNGCNGLYITAIPSGVTEIPAGAFQQCNNLGAFGDKLSLPDGITTIGNQAFYGCKNLDIDKLPSSLTTIGTSAFNDCPKLSISSLPDSVTKIGHWAFEKCTNITVSKLPANIEEIGSYAFENCTKVNITETPLEYRYYDFNKNERVGVTYLGTMCEYPVVVSETKKSGWYGDYAFEIDRATNTASIIGLSPAGEKATAITTMPDTICGAPITRIGDGTDGSIFYECGAMRLTELPNTVTEISGNTFYNCYNLALTSLPTNLVTIGYSAFYGCTGLALSSLPNGMKTIGGTAFYQCTGLTLTSLPNSVTSIGSSAFAECTNVNIKTVPCSYGRNAFRATQCENPTVVTPN